MKKSPFRSATEWTPKAIRELRVGLGWSAAQLSRRLGLSVKEVLDWEAARKVPNSEQIQHLNELQFYCDDCMRFTAESPQAEKQMKSKGLEQIKRDELEDVAED